MAEVVGCAKDQELSVEAASVRYINVTSPLSMEPNLACTVQATVARSGQQGPYAARWIASMMNNGCQDMFSL